MFGFSACRVPQRSGRNAGMSTYATTFACLLLTAACAVDAQGQGGSDVAADAQCGGSGTYYIHEYHVHGDGAPGEGRPTVVRPLFTRDPDGRIGDSGSYNRTLYMEEKARWLERFRDLNDKLAAERTRRIDIMARLLSWITAAERQRPAALTGSQVDLLKNMLVMWSDVDGWNYSRIVGDDQPPANLTAEQTGPEAGEPELPACNGTVVDNLERVVGEQRREMSKTKGEIQKLHKRYLTTYSGYRKMVANVREIRRDLRSWEHRAGRLLRLYEGQFGPAPKGDNAKERQGDDESKKMRDEIKTLKRRVWCLEQDHVDPLLCPNIKPPRTTTPTAEQRRPGDARSDARQHDGRGAYLSLDSFVAGNATSLLQDSIVDAGKALSEWQEEKLRQQRPKDCSEIDHWFQRREPVQVIYLDGRKEAVKALCDEGWNVIMRNAPYGERPLAWPDGVARNWEHYKYGFGAFESDVFWFGNEYVHQLTAQADYQLRIDVRRAADDRPAFAEYAFFRIAGEADGYRLAVGDNMGTAGDVLGVHSPLPVDRQRFATVDRHPPEMYNRLEFYREGWWYPTVAVRHDPDGPPEPCFTHLTHESPWICGADGYQQLSSVTMKIRPLRDGT